MSDNEEHEDKPGGQNPFEDLQRQLQEMFRNANINVVPTGMHFHRAGAAEPEKGGGDDAPPEPEGPTPLERIREFHLKPRDIKDDLDRFVIRQDEAKRAMEHCMRQVSEMVKGPGAGRESALRAIQMSGMKISFIRDVTPIPHNGCRPSKRRRV